ncbi:MAG: thermonuclease family protein [Patescibacteria group bacterium]
MNLFSKKQAVYIIAIILAVIQIFFGKNNSLPKVSIVPTPTSCRGQACLTQVKVTRVVDGDTIEIEGKIKVRYIGINSPEIYHDSTGKKTGEQCFANESYLENKKLVEGKTITLIKDVSDKDKYGRLLRYVYLNDLFVNDYLITNGYAKIMMIKPDIKYYQQFKDDQAEAKVNNLGIWKICN